MSFLVMIVIGAIAGYIASLVMKSPQGILMDIVLGIIGALVGGFIFNLFGQPGVTGFDLYSILVAAIGAIVVLAIYKMYVGRRVM